MFNNILSNFIIPIIIIYLLFTIINIVKDYKRYGSKIFDSFKRYQDTGNLKDIIINILEQECLDRPIIISNSDNSFIALTEKEIYGILIIEFDGKLSGNLKDQYLIVDGTEKNYKNPLCKFTEELKLIKKQGINIYPLIIKNGRNINLDIESLPQKRLMTIKDFSYYLYTCKRNKPKYTSDALKKYSKVINKILNDN